MDYVSKLRTYIRESEEIIARQKAAAARLGGDSSEADLTQKLLRWLEHMHATQVAELARVERIRTNSQRAHWPTQAAASGDPSPSRKATNSYANAPDTTHRSAAGGAMIDRARDIFDFP